MFSLILSIQKIIRKKQKNHHIYLFYIYFNGSKLSIFLSYPILPYFEDAGPKYKFLNKFNKKLKQVLTDKTQRKDLKSTIIFHVLNCIKIPITIIKNIVNNIVDIFPIVIAKYISRLVLVLSLIYEDVIVGYGPPLTNPLAATKIIQYIIYFF